MLLMLGIAALAVDIGFARTERLDLQNAADAAALAGAFELPDDADLARDTAAEYAFLGVSIPQPGGSACGADTECFTAGPLTVRVTSPYSKPGSTVPAAQAIRVQICSDSPTFFGKVLGASSVGVCGDAVAASGPGGPACVLCVLGGNGTTLSNVGVGRLTVRGGNIGVNSNAPDAVRVTGSGGISTDGEFGINGGASAPPGALSPEPTHQDPIDDPLADLPVPVLAGSPAPRVSINGKADVTLSPGIYSEIVSSSSGQITLQPGVYVVTQGIRLSKSSDPGKFSLVAHGVTVYFACAGYPTPCSPGQVGADLTMSGATTVSWTPPSSGPYQGVSIFSDRNNAASITLVGSSGSSFAGAIYARSGTLRLSGNSGTSTTMTSTIVVGALEKSGTSSVDLDYDEALLPPGMNVRIRRLIG
jgi:hypothetical protein